MAHRPVTLFVSLIALAAATAITGAALVSWTGGISERLTAQTAISETIADTAIIGGVDTQEVYAYQAAPPPIIPYRAADERLPSQTAAPQTAAPLAAITPADDLVITLDDTATADAAMAILLADVPAPAPDDPLDRQAAILADMRRTVDPADASF